MGRSIYCENCGKFIYKYAFGMQESELEYLSVDFGMGACRKAGGGAFLTFHRGDLQSLKVFHANRVKPKVAEHLLQALALSQSGLDGGTFNEDLDLVSYRPHTPFGEAYGKYLAESDALFFLMADAVCSHAFEELRGGRDEVTFFGEY